MKFIINLTTFDPAIGEVLNKLGRKRGMYIEKALTEFINTKKGRDVFQMMISEGEEVISDEPKPAPAKHKALKPKPIRGEPSRHSREQEKPQKQEPQDQAGNKIDLDSFL